MFKQIYDFLFKIEQKINGNVKVYIHTRADNEILIKVIWNEGFRLNWLVSVLDTEQSYLNSDDYVEMFVARCNVAYREFISNEIQNKTNDQSRG